MLTPLDRIGSVFKKIIHRNFFLKKIINKNSLIKVKVGSINYLDKDCAEQRVLESLRL